VKPVNEAVRAEARAAVAVMPPLTTAQRDALRDLLEPVASKAQVRRASA
jgi:hypothetical protein